MSDITEMNDGMVKGAYAILIAAAAFLLKHVRDMFVGDAGKVKTLSGISEETQLALLQQSVKDLIDMHRDARSAFSTVATNEMLSAMLTKVRELEESVDSLLHEVRKHHDLFIKYQDSR